MRGLGASTWRSATAAATVVGVVLLLAAPAAAGPRLRGAAPTPAALEEQLLAFTGPSGAQFESQADALAEQLGIPLSDAALDERDVGAGAAQLRASLTAIADEVAAGRWAPDTRSGVAAMLAFRARAGRPGQVPISTPLALLVAATGQVFLPAIAPAQSTAPTGPVDPRTLPPVVSTSTLLGAITPVLEAAKADGLTRRSARASLLPGGAEAQIRGSLEASGLSGRTLDVATQLGVLTARAIVAGARA